MRVLHMLRLVMYIDAKSYLPNLKDKSWTFNNHLFWLKIKTYLENHGGEDVLTTMKLHKPKYDEIKWNFKEHLEKLSFN